jgi:hypothetical protein
MNLDLACLSLADMRLKLFTEMEVDLEAQFLELLELRQRVHQAEQLRARRPRINCHRRSRLGRAASLYRAAAKFSHPAHDKLRRL